MDHLQNVLSYFDQQQPLCAEHDRIPRTSTGSSGSRPVYATRTERAYWQV